ncbi:hypothetical protein JCM14469_16430 [Desulfatiferula olefinivorans]
MPDSHIKKHALVAALLLSMLLLVYGQVRRHGFINFDDQDYVTHEKIRNGLSVTSLAWAFSLRDNDLTYYHPLTYVAHMIDCRLFGTDSGAHHLSSLALHMVNSLLLYALLFCMTGAVRRSALVAFLFALHPIGVDSVAWIAQKKTLLSALFFLLSLLAWTRYAKTPGLTRYLVVCLALAAGLLSKPVLVTLPAVLLLVDIWPLNRWRRTAACLPENPFFRCESRSFFDLVLEKIPLSILVGLWAVTPFLAEHVTAKNIPLAVVPMGLRVKNALLSCFVYLKQYVWPLDLSFLYPYPDEVNTAGALAALVGLLGISVLALRSFRRLPYLAVGWFFYLIVLFPFLGLVQGAVWPAHADRFAYLPLIGIHLIVAWGGFDLMRYFRLGPRIAWPAVVVPVCFFAALTARQAAYWKSNETLYTRALALNDRNYLAYHNLGVAYDEAGRTDEARKQYYLCLWAKPGYSRAHHNLALNRLKAGDTALAREHFLAALSANPDIPEALYNLGALSANDGRIDDAVSWYLKALAQQPDFPEAHNNLGVMRLRQGLTEEAAEHFRQAVRYKPDHLEALANLGNTLFDLGRVEAALMCFSRVLTVDPGNIMAMNDMGVVYAATNRTVEAEALFRRVLDIDPGNTAALDNLALIAAKKNTLEAEYNRAVEGRDADFEDPEKQLRAAALAAALGRVSEAESLFSDVLTLMPNHPMALSGLGALAQARGRYGDAAVFYARLADHHHDLRGEAYYALACISVLDERLDDGLSFLKRAADAGFTDWHRLAVDSRLEKVRRDLRFQAFMDRVGFFLPAED